MLFSPVYMRLFDRILIINADSTSDIPKPTAEGHGIEEEALAMLIVTAPRSNPDQITLQLHLDNIEIPEVRPHADPVSISTAQLRELLG